ncbi:MAG: response regulator [Chloroflexi bacterium]|nr:response regulator [Chloroflexota bacterium]
MKILVAEDDADIRDLLEIACLTLGHSVRLARDGQEAWELFLVDGADVIISDWLMPRMQGTELCRRVRARDDVPYVYFVILTALDGEDRMLEGMQAGADDYLTKPFSIGALQARLVAAQRVTTLHRALAQRDAERALSLARHAAVLRVARSLAAEGDPAALLRNVVEEAVALIGGEGGALYRWDEQQQCLTPVAASQHALRDGSHPDGPFQGNRDLHLGEGAVGRAAELRTPVVAHAGTPEAEVVAPLLHDGRLVGALAIGVGQTGRSITAENVESLEMLASVAAAALVGLERAQLVAVALAARELAHVLNNDLALPVGALELIREDPSLEPHLRQIVDDASMGLASAAGHVRRLQQVVRIETKQTPVGPALDLERSAQTNHQGQ